MGERPECYSHTVVSPIWGPGLELSNLPLPGSAYPLYSGHIILSNHRSQTNFKISKTLESTLNYEINPPGFVQKFLVLEYNQYLVTINGVNPLKIVNHYVIRLKYIILQINYTSTKKLL